MQAMDFIQTGHFEKAWAKLGLDDDDLFKLQVHLMDQPLAGKVILRSGGLRKLRWAMPGRGKRGGVRVIYLCVIDHETIALLDVFSKSQQENLTSEELSKLKELAARIIKELSL